MVYSCVIDKLLFIDMYGVYHVTLVELLVVLVWLLHIQYTVRTSLPLYRLVVYCLAPAYVRCVLLHPCKDLHIVLLLL